MRVGSGHPATPVGMEQAQWRRRAGMHLAAKGVGCSATLHRLAWQRPQLLETQPSPATPPQPRTWRPSSRRERERRARRAAPGSWMEWSRNGSSSSVSLCRVGWGWGWRGGWGNCTRNVCPAGSQQCCAQHAGGGSRRSRSAAQVGPYCCSHPHNRGAPLGVDEAGALPHGGACGPGVGAGACGRGAQTQQLAKGMPEDWAPVLAAGGMFQVGLPPATARPPVLQPQPAQPASQPKRRQPHQ